MRLVFGDGRQIALEVAIVTLIGGTLFGLLLLGQRRDATRWAAYAATHHCVSSSKSQVNPEGRVVFVGAIPFYSPQDEEEWVCDAGVRVWRPVRRP